MSKRQKFPCEPAQCGNDSAGVYESACGVCNSYLSFLPISSSVNAILNATKMLAAVVVVVVLHAWGAALECFMCISGAAMYPPGGGYTARIFMSCPCGWEIICISYVAHP